MTDLKTWVGFREIFQFGKGFHKQNNFKTMSSTYSIVNRDGSGLSALVTPSIVTRRAQQMMNAYHKWNCYIACCRTVCDSGLYIVWMETARDTGST